MTNKQNPAVLAGTENTCPSSRITIERFWVESHPCGRRGIERITIQCGDFLEFSFVDHQPDAIENNSDRFSFKVTTPGGQPCEVDGREVNAVKFTIVGNVELATFLSAVAELARRRRKCTASHRTPKRKSRRNNRAAP